MFCLSLHLLTLYFGVALHIRRQFDLILNPHSAFDQRIMEDMRIKGSENYLTTLLGIPLPILCVTFSYFFQITQALLQLLSEVWHRGAVGFGYGKSCISN